LITNQQKSPAKAREAKRKKEWFYDPKHALLAKRIGADDARDTE